MCLNEVNIWIGTCLIAEIKCVDKRLWQDFQDGSITNHPVVDHSSLVLDLRFRNECRCHDHL
jgi:hypothetical protein